MPPILLSLIAAAALCSYWILWAYREDLLAEVVAGRLDSIAVRANFTGLLLVCLLPAMRYYLAKWTRSNAESVRRDHGVQLPPPRAPGLGWGLGAVGAVGFVYLFLGVTTPESHWRDPAAWDVSFILPLLFLPLMGWNMARFSHDLISATVLFTRLAAEIPQIDVLMPHTLRPLANQGVRASLLVVVVLSISSNLFLDPGEAVLGSSIITGLLIGVGMLVVVVPALPVHRRIGVEKNRELARVRAQIRASLKALDAGATDTALGDWLALEQRLAAVNEWPYDAGSFTRVALYLLLGIGSWVGAALVERLLESSF